MTLGSLFSGSGGFELAGALNGIEPRWSSEIEPYPLRVTAARFPNVKQLGDITKIDGGKIEPVDIITGGSPCQSISICGDRTGLAGQSGLFYEMVRVIKEMRDATGNRYPRFVVWENVANARVSNHGEDFRKVIEEFCRIADQTVSIPRPEKGWKWAGCVVGDGWSLAWRLLDAQYWSVPQRRTRFYLIVDLGSERAGEILFEPESGSGYSWKSEEAWQRAAPYVDRGVDRTREPAEGRLIEVHAQDGRCKFVGDVCPTVTQWWGTGGNNVPLVLNSSGGGIMATLDASYYKGCGTRNGNEREFILVNENEQFRLRRLTPIEAFRLQGLPDWWGDGVKGSDSEKYRMAGNGIAIPCAYDILRRIAGAE